MILPSARGGSLFGVNWGCFGTDLGDSEIRGFLFVTGVTGIGEVGGVVDDGGINFFEEVISPNLKVIWRSIHSKR